MIKYICETCNIEGDLSTCSVCGERTQIKSKLYWCKECNVPLYEENCSLCVANSGSKLPELGHLGILMIASGKQWLYHHQ